MLPTLLAAATTRACCDTRYKLWHVVFNKDSSVDVPVAGNPPSAKNPRQRRNI